MFGSWLAGGQRQGSIPSPAYDNYRPLLVRGRLCLRTALPCYRIVAPKQTQTNSNGLIERNEGNQVLTVIVGAGIPSSSPDLFLANNAVSTWDLMTVHKSSRKPLATTKAHGSSRRLGPNVVIQTRGWKSPASCCDLGIRSIKPLSTAPITKKSVVPAPAGGR
jgi:hypothetical protein